MSLQFIIGGSGSGKTRRLYENLIEEAMACPEGHFFAIVPEQFTMQTQKEIVELHPRHGVMNIDIVSFERLAYRIFEELAVESLSVLDDMGKSMVLRKVASGVRSDLRLFGGHLDKIGFVGQLKSMLSEFFQYGVTPERLRELETEADGNLLRQKLHDMRVLYEAFQSYTEDKMIVKEELLTRLCRVLPRSELIRQSVVTLDGYTGFTPVQYQLLELLLGLCRRVTVTVTMDAGENPYRNGSPQELFYMSRHTICRLIDLASAAGCGREQDILLDGRPYWRFAGSPQLQTLERELFRYGKKNGKVLSDGASRGCDSAPGSSRQSVFVWQAASPSREIELVCGEMERLVKEEGFLYREMAVITGDLETYSREILRQFGENQIPCFLDYKKSIMANPMVELLRAALEVLRESFSYESVFRYLKTGLVLPGETERVSRLENYVIALGIRGFKNWNTPWERVYRGVELLNLAALNETRETVLAPFLPLKEVMASKRATVRDMTEALVHFLEALHIEEKMQSMETMFLARGEESLAKEYGQVYGLVLDLFDRVTALLGEEQVSRKEYCDILDAGFSEIKVGLIPAVVDRVVVGDITRTRLSHIRALFFVGVNDGVVPNVSGRGGILSEAERGRLASCQVELAPGVREEGFLQRFYLYLALTKASDRLYLSYAATAPDGKALRPSSLIGQVEKLFAGQEDGVGSEESNGAGSAERHGTESGVQSGMGSMVWHGTGSMARHGMGSVARHGTEREGANSAGQNGVRAQMNSGPQVLALWSRPLGMRYVIQGLRDYGNRRQDPLFWELYRYFSSEERHRERMEALVDAAFYRYEDRGIGRTAAKELYGQILRGSVTRMELYASCAYAHFLAYGLELRERPVYELAPADIGNLFHESIDRYFKTMKAEHRSFRDISEEERKRLVSRCVAEVTAEYGNTIMSSSSRNQYLGKKVERITDRTIWALTEQLRQGDFEPAGFELSFSPADNLRAMKIPISEEEAIHLRGRIDRVDLCRDGDRLYLAIIDYKTGRTKFDLPAVYRGLQLQLAVYMDAALEKVQRQTPELRVVPAGIFYYNIDDPMVERTEESAEGTETSGNTSESGQAPGMASLFPERPQLLKKLRMNGLVNRDPEALHHLDHRLVLQKGEAADSQTVPVSVKNEEIVERRSSVAGEERFAVLSSFVRGKLKRMGREILEGNTPAAPYKDGTRTACDYCPYHSVCGFDLKTEGYGFRRFDRPEPEEIWERMEREAKQEVEGTGIEEIGVEGTGVEGPDAGGEAGFAAGKEGR